jgi:glycosyltransferase involved in cell wall biosynthesis
MKQFQNPKITVTMPAFDVERYIGPAIESVLRQDWTDFELIILDDCSQDRTWEIAREYLSDFRVRLYRNRRKMCDAANRNLILRLSRGKYIAPHDADDIMLQGRLKKQVEFLEAHPEVGVVFGNAIFANERMRKGYYVIRPLSPKGVFLSRSGSVTVLDSNFSHCSSLARKEEIHKAGGYDQTLVVGTDARLYRRLLRRTRFYYLNQMCFVYRKRSNSSYNSYFAKRLSMRRYFTKQRAWLPRRIIVDRFSIDLHRMPVDVRDATAWRLSFYVEKMGWNQNQEKAEPLILPVTALADQAADYDTYRTGFLQPFAQALTKKNEWMLEAGLVSMQEAGIVLVGPSVGANGDWILPFIKKGFYFYTGTSAILYHSGSGIVARGLVDPLVFSVHPKNAGGIVPPVFWNPRIGKYCTHVDTYKTFGVRFECALKIILKIDIDNSLSKIVKRPMRFAERRDSLRQRFLAYDGRVQAGAPHMLENAARLAKGLAVRLPARGLNSLPNLVQSER